MRPARISLAPVYMTPAPTSPRSTVEESERAEVVARVRNTLSRMRRTPPSKTAASRPSAWYPFTTRTPPSDSVSRPVTSAYICPRSRNTGRSTRNPRKTTSPKTASATRVRRVTRGLRRSITVKASVAVSRPPASSMRPVPTRFRKPSTSFMIRDTRSPVLFASWNAIGSRPTCSCTRIRMSAISCCAAFETSCTSAKEPRPCTTVAATTAPTRGSSRSIWRRPMTSSIRYLVEAGRTSPATRLTAMSRKARASSPRRGFMRAHTSGSSARSRSGLRARDDCRDSLVTTRVAPLTAAFYRGDG